MIINALLKYFLLSLSSSAVIHSASASGRFGVNLSSGSELSQYVEALVSLRDFGVFRFDLNFFDHLWFRNDY